MKITRAARTLLSVTALAWAIPFAQAEDKGEPRAGNVSFIELDTNRDDLVKANTAVAGVKDSLAVRN